MKVIFLFRQPRTWLFSIENVFDLIKTQLPQNFEVQTFYSSDWFFKDLLGMLNTKTNVYHITGHVHYLGIFLPKRKTLLTIHDLGHYENTLKGFRKWLYGVLWFRWPMSGVRHITTISNFTRQRLLTHFPIDSSKISVVYNPVHPQYVFSTSPNNKVPVILQIGSGHNKNRNRLIEACKSINCTICFVGKLSSEEKQRLEYFQIKYIAYENVEQQEMFSLYHNANLLFFASTYEGFGLPIVEANASGVPVITSNVGAMLEISNNGRAACLVNPFNVDEITHAIQRILHEDEYREQLIQNGVENAKKFRAEHVVSQYVSLYKKLYSQA